MYATFLACSGVALMLSMPWTSRLDDLMSYPWRPFPVPFFLTYGFFSAWVALDRAAEAVPIGRPRPATLAVAAVRVALAQALALPLVVLSRVLFPDDWAPIPLAAAYVTLVSLAAAAGSVVLEIHAIRRGKHPVVVRYLGLLALLSLPAIFLGLNGPLRAASHVSPAVALVSIVAGTATLAEYVMAFSSAAALVVGFSVWALALTRSQKT